MNNAYRFSDELTPIEATPAPSVHSDQLCLLVIGDGFVSTHALPSAGDIVVGRSSGADVFIDVPCISRRHALIHIAGSISIEDLGSANGTHVRDQRLQRGRSATIAVGEMIELGSTMVVLQQGYSSVRPRRIWSHGHFEARLDEECARVDRDNGGFALLRIRATGRSLDPATLNRLLLSALRPSDILAAYGPNDYEVLVPGTCRATSQQVLERLCECLRSGCTQVRSGSASYPKDGRVPEALIAKACADIEATTAAVGEDRTVIVESPMMLSLHKLTARVAAGSINTLILGETGVGKEIFAERIHALSTRVGKPLLRLNCAALSEGLLESELFGHERGAFTGADQAKPGLLEIADGGTVFLDEIGDMPATIQAKLLRTLEERTVRRVGGLSAKPIDIRIVAATHKNLEAEVAQGRFRQDLFFRIAGVTLVVPPLRQRLEEIQPLAMTFIANACRRQRHPRQVILSEDALERLLRYEWPGNIRELRNITERAVLLCDDGIIRAEHLDVDKMGNTYCVPERAPRIVRNPPPRPSSESSFPTESETMRVDRVDLDLRRSMKLQERDLISDALERTGGNQTAAAKILGVSRRTLISRIEEHDLPRPRKRP